MLETRPSALRAAMQPPLVAGMADVELVLRMHIEVPDDRCACELDDLPLVAQPDNSAVKAYMVVGAKAKDILRSVGPVMGPTNRPKVGTLCVRAARCPEP